jgi:hypothetical protein
VRGLVALASLLDGLVSLEVPLKAAADSHGKIAGVKVAA